MDFYLVCSFHSYKQCYDKNSFIDSLINFIYPITSLKYIIGSETSGN